MGTRGWQLCLVSAMVLIGIMASSAKPHAPQEHYALADKRIEWVARAICQAKGIDPDYRGYPFPEGPVWEVYIPQAREFVLQYDAVTRRK